MRLQAQGVQLAYDQRVIAHDLTLTIPDGKVSVLIGPNGSGKSTALRALARLLPPRKGSVILDGKSIQETPTKEVARLLAILPQVLVTPESISVEDLVWFGRHPHRASLKVPSLADKEAVEWAMDVTSTAELRHQHVDQLSGGQRPGGLVTQGSPEDVFTCDIIRERVRGRITGRPAPGQRQTDVYPTTSRPPRPALSGNRIGVLHDVEPCGSRRAVGTRGASVA